MNAMMYTACDEHRDSLTNKSLNIGGEIQHRHSNSLVESLHLQLSACFEGLCKKSAKYTQ